MKVSNGFFLFDLSSAWRYFNFLALDEKEEHVLELEEKKQEKLAEAKMHRESSKGTPPPESQFKKLAPNENKYTMLDHDEL